MEQAIPASIFSVFSFPRCFLYASSIEMYRLKSSALCELVRDWLARDGAEVATQELCLHKHSPLDDAVLGTQRKGALYKKGQTFLDNVKYKKKIYKYI